MGLIGTKKHPNNQQRAAKRGLGWVGVQGSGCEGARGGKRESVRGETEDGLPPERQRQASLSLSPSVSARVSFCLLGLLAFFS